MILLLPQAPSDFLLFAHGASASGLQKTRFVSPQTRIITPATKPTQRAHEGQPPPPLNYQHNGRNQSNVAIFILYLQAEYAQGHNYLLVFAGCYYWLVW